MEIESERQDQILVVSLAGSFDALTADQVLAYVGAQFVGDQRQIVLDLHQVDFMSSSGMRALLELLKKGRTVDGDLRLADPQPGVQRSLEIAGLVRVLKVYPSREEAIRSFRGPGR
jgi:anti-anti-sigma factor